MHVSKFRVKEFCLCEHTPDQTENKAMHIFCDGSNHEMDFLGMNVPPNDFWRIIFFSLFIQTCVICVIEA